MGGLVNLIKDKLPYRITAWYNLLIFSIKMNLRLMLIRERERGSTVNRLLTKSVSLKGNLFAQCLNGAIRRSCRTLYIHTHISISCTWMRTNLGKGTRGLWWPLSCRADKKFSFKTVGRDTTLCCRRGTLQPARGQASTMARGVCPLGVCPIYTASLSTMGQRKPSSSLPPPPSCRAPLHRWTDAKPTRPHCRTPSSQSYDDFIVKKRQLCSLSLSPSCPRSMISVFLEQRGTAFEWNRNSGASIYSFFPFFVEIYYI